ncbi:type VI secretion system tip protein TssI/VgrG [Polyangium jinanense]|uniref:Type VI secretion system tip protein VgrG n=1 Tax=Polyangium jinanense TaxID=2829994 RepID=A0A9X3XAG3_9BACT|nr:type VI secretion system tip protein TssI/VgrG [Polyangium jinanense]MDC3960498.1 type VI secretion system tip protein VgrG [Polyangium jinanense]MDC3986729.1 type VI secretion system tip protein VgrG [Polyangium jinanense]
MAVLDLHIRANITAALSPYRFSIRESASSLFTVSLWAHSPDPSLDLTAVLDQPATFRIVAGYLEVANLGARTFRGIIVDTEQVYALQPAPGQKGLSTYHFRIVPDLFRLTQRRGNRIFQHLSIPDIIDKLLAEWSVEKVWHIDRTSYPKLEYKVQYAETDFQFVSRLLEEAGIVYTFPESEDGKLALSDRLEANPRRPGPPIRYVDHPSQASEKECVTAVRFAREVRPGAFAARDHDFRNPDFPLFGDAPHASAPEARLEQYHFDQGAFLVETGKGGGTPVADDKGVARHDAKYGKLLAERSLHGERAGVRGVFFEANTFDLAPGAVFSIDQHPHPDLPHDRKLLVLETTLEGTANDEWSLTGHAVFADTPHRPPRRTPKPIVHGLQSATVVGPQGQEVHTDEFGRVRVQFPWDREGKKNDGSSCWVRVNQGWGGMGYGMIVLPRIGQEVMVGFLEGDPDQPIIVGRVYNAVQQVPYRLPEHKTRSTWKSDSSLGSGGFNEIMFEDLKEKELVWQQAEKDRTRLVKNDEFATVVHDRQKLVKNDEFEHTDGCRWRWVGNDGDQVTMQKKRERIDGDVSVEVLGSRNEQVDGNHSLTVVDDRQEGVSGRYALKANEQIHALAGEELVAEADEDLTVAGPGGFLRIDASGVTIEGTLVKINVSGKPGKGKGSKPQGPEEPALGAHAGSAERGARDEQAGGGGEGAFAGGQGKAKRQRKRKYPRGAVDCRGKMLIQQEKPMSCGPAAVRMVIQSRTGVNVAEETLREESSARGSPPGYDEFNGTYTRDILTMLKDHGVSNPGQWKRKATIKDMESALAKGRPAMLLLRSPGHFVVLDGIQTTADGKKKLLIRDPALPGRQGCRQIAVGGDEWNTRIANSDDPGWVLDLPR